MSKVLRRNEITNESRWQPQSVSLPESLSTGIDAEMIAQNICRQAEEKAVVILAQAQQEAEEMKTRARDDGYAAGQAQAETEALQRLEAINALFDEINREREEFFDRSEAELVRLSIAIAEKVLAQQLAVKPETIVDLTKTHLKRIRERESVSIRLNPEDLPLLSQARESLLHEIDGLREIHLHEDRRVGPGGIIIESTNGTFDARFSSQLDAVREALEETLEGSDEPEVD